MAKQSAISLSATFTDGDILTGYEANSAGFDSLDVENYLKTKIPVTAAEISASTKIITLTLADGDTVVGTVT